MAEAVGFEPTNELPRYRISSAGRYDHFDTLPYCIVCKRLEVDIQGTLCVLPWPLRYTSVSICQRGNYIINNLFLQQILHHNSIIVDNVAR